MRFNGRWGAYEHDLQDFHFVFMELPKFKKSLSELSNIQEKWDAFAREVGVSEVQTKNIGEALSVIATRSLIIVSCSLRGIMLVIMAYNYIFA